MIELPLSDVYQLIEPGPVVLLTTRHKGEANVMTMSWHMMMEFTPPLIACIVSTGDFSFTALRATKECVIAIPTVDLIDPVVGVGTCSGADTDKFARFGLTPAKAKRVRAPLIAECVANIECRVVDIVKKHDIVVLEGVAAWVDATRKETRTLHAVGDGTFIVDGRRIDRRKAMRSKLPAGV